jgi:magnesium-protoporphyrin IX monomethyl ester (oxidative) cyclase
MKVGLYLACYPDLVDDWNYTLPPLGLGYLAAYAAKYVDGVEFIISRDLPALIDAKPDLVGVTFVTFNASVAADHAGQIKDALGIPVICGGPHVSTLPTMLDPVWDCAVLGEGEETFAEILLLMKAEGKLDAASLAKVQGVLYRDDAGQLVRTPPRPMIRDLDIVPYPDRRLMYSQWNRPGREAQIMTSRGCPYDCSFCSTVRHWGTTYRFPSEDYVVGEIELLRNEYDPKTIHIYDDLFVVRKDRVLRLLAKMRERGLHKGVTYTCFVRSNLLDDELMAAFAETEVQVLNIGFESGSDEMLEVYNKKSANVGKNQRAIELGRKHGLRYTSCFILGGPGETRDDIQKTFAFIADNIDALAYVEFAPLAIFPGTDMWRRVKELGIRGEDDMRGIVLAPEDIRDARHYIMNNWPYMNEENIPREEFHTYLQLGYQMARIVWEYHNQRKRGLDETKRARSAEFIAENIPISRIVRAKAGRRLRKIMPMGEWFHVWDPDEETARAKIERGGAA